MHVVRKLLVVVIVTGGLACQPQRESSEASPWREAPEGAPPPFFREFALDVPASGPAILAVDEEDGVWVALAKTGRLARMSNGQLRLFDLGQQSRPVGLAIGTRENQHPGEIWIAASYDNKLIRFDRVTCLWTEYELPASNSWPFNVALGPDGSVWFTQRFAGRVGRMDPKTGRIRGYALASKESGPAGLGVDMRTGRVWFTEGFVDTVASLDPDTGAIREYKLGEEHSGVVSGPAGLAVDAQGGVWFAKLEGKLGYLAPGAVAPRLFDVPPMSKRPAGVAVSPSGDVWTLALDGNAALRFQPSTETFTRYAIPTGGPDEEPGVPPTARTSRPFGLGFDRQGNLWFSEQYTGKLGVLDLSPPTVAIVSPAGVAEGGRALFSARVTDAVSGVRETVVRLDGTPVTPEQGTLELAGLRPGAHRLEVSATDYAGLTGRVESTFDYRPGSSALVYAFKRLRPKDAPAAPLRDRLIQQAESLGGVDARSALAELDRQLVEAAPRMEPFPLDAYREAIAFQLANTAGQVDVRILDQPPYFDRKQVVIRPGDVVRWRYDAPNSGHTASTTTQRLVMDLDGKKVDSGELKSGGRFAYRFEKPGRFLVRNAHAPSAELRVEVGSP